MNTKVHALSEQEMEQSAKASAEASCRLGFLMGELRHQTLRRVRESMESENSEDDNLPVANPR